MMTTYEGERRRPAGAVSERDQLYLVHAQYLVKKSVHGGEERKMMAGHNAVR